MNNLSIKEMFNNKYVIIFILIFIIIRLFFIFGFKTVRSDINVYSYYGFEEQLGKSNNMNLYNFHAFYIDERNKINNSIPESGKIIEYPPLAVKWITFPNFFLNYDKTIEIKSAYRQYSENYYYIFKILTFLLELVCFIVLIFLILKIYGQNNFVLRGVLFIISGLSLPHVLYDRLDLVLGIFIAISVAFLILNKSYIFSFFILSLGINFKLIPLFLVPLFILSSLPADFYTALFRKEKILKSIIILFERLLILITFILLTAIPFYLVYGEKCYKFFSFHNERGLQLESIYSSLTLFINLFVKIKTEVYHAFGGYNLKSDISTILVSMSTPLVVTAFVCLIILTIFIFMKRSEDLQTNKTDDSQQNIAGKNPEIFILLSFLFISIPMLLSKVFSPQYLLWLTPFVMIFPFRNKVMIVLPWFLILINVVTTIIFPYTYFTDIIKGPTLFGTLLLILRNFMFFIFNILIVIELFKYLGIEPVKNIIKKIKN